MEAPLLQGATAPQPAQSRKIIESHSAAESNCTWRRPETHRRESLVAPKKFVLMSIRGSLKEAVKLRNAHVSIHSPSLANSLRKLRSAIGSPHAA